MTSYVSGRLGDMKGANVLQNYRRAVAGALVTVLVAGAASAGLDVPEGVGEAFVTLVVFALGYLPPPSESQ